MKVEVEKLRVEKDISMVEDISADLWDMDSADVTFINNVQVRCRFLLVATEILVDCEIDTESEIICSRCLENAKQNNSYEFRLSYNIDELGDYLELDEDIREQVLLNFPMKVLCGPDCRGICPYCGANLNIEDCDCSK